MSSSNPFRKKGPQSQGRFPPVDAIDTSIAEASQPPPPTSFRNDDSDAPAASTQKKTKVIKKVRVLSPPPLSPDSPEWPHSNTATPLGEDPFNNGGTYDTEREATPPPPPPPPPENPFSKTLQDMEGSNKERELKEERREEGAVLKAANNARGSLNVDSFRRLLMTGNTGDGSGAMGEAETSGRPPGTEDTLNSGAAHQTINAGDEGDLSDSSLAVQFGQRKKAPPPPPSSRHGRSIKTDIETTEQSETPKNLHLEPATTDGDIGAGEAAEKPPNLETGTTAGAKKPAPTPPPRRGHAKAETKAPAPGAAQEELASQPPTESGLARSNSIRQGGQAPAPPPPRRPHASHRLSSYQASPTSSNFNAPPPDGEKMLESAPSRETVASVEPSAVQDPQTGHVKLSGPPPPPARNSSTRRAPSDSSMDAPSRHASGETKPRDGLPPRPPPSRKRGGSKGSMDGQPLTTSTNTVPPAAEQPSTSAEPGHGDAILADLDALQREVDALRGQTG